MSKEQLYWCLSSNYIIYILNAQLLFVCLFVCLSRINWKDYESWEAENLYPGVILHCDNDLLVFEEKYSHLKVTKFVSQLNSIVVCMYVCLFVCLFVRIVLK